MKKNKCALRVLNYICLSVIVVFSLMTFAGCGGGGGGDEGVRRAIDDETTTVLEAQATIGSGGGLVEVADTNSLVYGAKIEIPENAVKDSTVIKIYSMNSTKTMEGQTISSPVIRMTADPADNFDKPVKVTIPYDVNKISPGYNENSLFVITTIDGKTEIIKESQIVERNTDKNTITYYKWHFCDDCVVQQDSINIEGHSYSPEDNQAFMRGIEYLQFLENPCNYNFKEFLGVEIDPVAYGELLKRGKTLVDISLSTFGVENILADIEALISLGKLIKCVGDYKLKFEDCPNFEELTLKVFESVIFKLIGPYNPYGKILTYETVGLIAGGFGAVMGATASFDNFFDSINNVNDLCYFFNHYDAQTCGHSNVNDAYQICSNQQFCDPTTYLYENRFASEKAAYPKLVDQVDISFEIIRNDGRRDQQCCFPCYGDSVIDSNHSNYLLIVIPNNYIRYKRSAMSDEEHIKLGLIGAQLIRQ